MPKDKLSPAALAVHRRKREQWFKNKIEWDKLQVERLKALGLSEALNADIMKNPADFATAILDTLGRRALEVSNDPEAGPNMVKIWMSLYLQAVSFERNQDIRERRMALREKEVALRKAQFERLKKTVQNNKLGAEETAKRLREIFTLSSSETNGHDGNGIAA